ncbi:MAG: 4Fe-4S ferredoxin, partial [Candidatus Cloacimonetes bacterium]|nr:4Fe-4S ferredoxin [Candidatus Cloacimonadota bacterium]
MIKIKKSEFNKFIENLQKNYSVFAPVTDGKATAFKKIKSADDINNKVLNTKRSLKEIFFP